MLLQILPQSLILKSQGLNLVSQFLVVFEQGCVICVHTPDLLHKILSTSSLLLTLHTLCKSLVRLNYFALVVNDDSLELIPLAHQLLPLKLHLLLHLKVLSQKCVPFPLALFLPSVMLI